VDQELGDIPREPYWCMQENSGAASTSAPFFHASGWGYTYIWRCDIMKEFKLIPCLTRK